MEWQDHVAWTNNYKELSVSPPAEAWQDHGVIGRGKGWSAYERIRAFPST